jgi:hypothetical protein
LPDHLAGVCIPIFKQAFADGTFNPGHLLSTAIARFLPEKKKLTELPVIRFNR